MWRFNPPPQSSTLLRGCNQTLNPKRDSATQYDYELNLISGKRNKNSWKRQSSEQSQNSYFFIRRGRACGTYSHSPIVLKHRRRLFLKFIWNQLAESHREISKKFLSRGDENHPNRPIRSSQFIMMLVQGVVVMIDGLLLILMWRIWFLWWQFSDFFLAACE